MSVGKTFLFKHKRLDICLYRHGILFDYWPNTNCYDPQWRTKGFYIGYYGLRIWNHEKYNIYTHGKINENTYK